MDQTFPLPATRRRPVREQTKPTAPAVPLAGRKLSAAQRMLVWIYLLAFAFDFKGKEEGGTIFQYLFVAISLMAAAGLALTFIGGNIRPAKGLRRINTLWIVYLVSTFFIAVLYFFTSIRKIDMGNYIRTVIPFVLCGISLLITQALYRKRIDPSELIKPLIVTGIINSLWLAFYSTRIRGIEMEQMRYQILSPASPMLLSYGLMALFLERKVRFLAVCALTASLSTALLSVTRNYVFTIVFCLLSVLYVLWINRDMISLRFVGQKLLLLVVPYLIFQAAIIVRPNLMAHWEYRLTRQSGSGTTKDATYLTRVAEFSGMYKEIHKDTVSTLFGAGIGATYKWNDAYKSQVSRHMYWDGRKVRFGVGHSLYIYPFFSSGYVLALLYLAVIFGGTWQTIKLAHNSKQMRGAFGIMPTALPLAAVMGYLSQGLTSNLYGSRHAALLFGLMIGMAYWCYELAKSAQSASSLQQVLPVETARGSVEKGRENF